MQTKPAYSYNQSAAIAFRRRAGSTSVLLITSHRGHHWVIPKGIVERGLTPAASARKEAWEEAGVHGQVGTTPVGTYDYEKWGGTCRVRVFLLEVEQVLDEWPESNVRRRRWVSPEAAATLVRNEGLRRILHDARSYLGEGAGFCPAERETAQPARRDAPA